MIKNVVALNIPARLQGTLRDAARRGIASAALAVEAVVKSETSRKKAVNTGAYKSAWRTQQMAPDKWRVANATPYAAVIEFGRRPGRFPPIGPIRLWAVRKLGVSMQEAAGIAFLIARKIARSGIQGRFVLEEQVTNGKVQRLLNQEVRREVLAAAAAAAAAGGTP